LSHRRGGYQCVDGGLTAGQSGGAEEAAGGPGDGHVDAEDGDAGDDTVHGGIARDSTNSLRERHRTDNDPGVASPSTHEAREHARVKRPG